jgi:hypothetical protein
MERAMITRREVTIAATVAGVCVALAFVVSAIRDRHRDADLVRLHQTIAADSARRVDATVATDHSLARQDTTAKAAAHQDSAWHAAASNARTTTGQILASRKPDTVKIQELVYQIDTLIVHGDSLAKADSTDRDAIAAARVSFGIERAAWSTERKTLAHSLDVSEARHRHWGLGVTAGPTIVRDPQGVVRGGLGMTIGVTYRW